MQELAFSEECVFISEPTDRLLFEHEVTVTRFLSVVGKFGMGRMPSLHMSNPRLANHGGVSISTVKGDEGWSSAGSNYELKGPWGLIGDLDQPKPQAYLFRPSLDLRRTDKGAVNSREEEKVEVTELNRFEAHAVALLRQGEKLVRWENDRALHAVGAIRAETQCLRCHVDNKPGDLLGAFTYCFTKTPSEPMDERTHQILKLHEKGLSSAAIATAVGLDVQEARPASSEKKLSYEVLGSLIRQGIVTEEFIAMHAEQRKYVLTLLDQSLGPVKKPRAAAGAE